MSSGPEYNEVERPLIEQLVAMGWRHITGNLDHPESTGRGSFREVLLLGDLRDALRRINLDPKGQPWLDEDRLAQATGALRRLGASKLLEANQNATELLLKGTVVDGVPGWAQGRGRTVRYIDWDHPKNNRFTVINQLKVACPAGQPHKHIIPDLVLFVNGIPLVVVEAKSPYISAPMESAVNQLQRYANRRRALGVVAVNEGSERLFYYSQFMVATCGEQARVGTFSSRAVHFLEWKDTSPTPMAQVAAALNKTTLSSQEKLVAGMLRPSNLLDIVRHFTLFMEVETRVIKIVCRYQQFRAVQLATQRLLTGETRLQDGEHDHRGGIVWHTQGSGKSLTMVFLIRKMRSIPALRRFKIVVVTDRRALQKQLSDTAALTGEVLTVVRAKRRGSRTVSSHEVLQEVLAREGKDLVFTMVQKYRGELMDPEAEVHEAGPIKTTPLPELNTDEAILVLVDEAHRSHTNTAHANLMRALPNCARIGFTGTPIIMRAKGQTTAIFGTFIDRYTIAQSEADGATVPIFYEGRTMGAAVNRGGKLDELFEDMLVGRTEAELEAIKKKYATKGHVTEAPKLIAAKARDMLRHYVEHILPNGFKAQVVAVSRRATIRYYEAFRAAQAELVAQLEALDSEVLALDGAAVAKLKPERAFLVRAHRFLPTIAALQFAPIISGTHNDTVDPKGEWSSGTKIKTRVARFKKPLFADGPNSFDPHKTEGKADPLAFLLVKSMLLTGFDAPVEQVMYLDRHIKEAELLQAIARVNRTYGDTKRAGIVVDYYGVASHLKEALQAYSAEDVAGALRSLKDELPKLRDQHRRAVSVFTSRDVHTPCSGRLADTEACVALLHDERLRAEFHVKLKHFLATLDLVLPRPEGLPYSNDAKVLAHIQARARNRYRGSERLIGEEVGEKVRRLIDEHVISLGIDPKIAPMEITSAGFDAHVDQERSPRAKASEMEHALRYHIRKHLDEDPVYYETLSKRLKGILQALEGRWDEQAEALKALVSEAKAGRESDDDTGLDPVTQAPFFDLLKGAAVGDGELEADAKTRLCELTVELVAHMQQEMGLVEFWARTQAREGLRSWVFMTLDTADVLPFEALDPVADKLMELAKANHHRLVAQ